MRLQRSHITLQLQMDESQGRPSGFDYMRLVLALAVIAWHSIVTSYGNVYQDEIWGSYWRAPLALIIPMFFCLSGFLVAGSLERSKTLITFLGLRLYRIVPALAMEVLLSALVLGTLLTTEPLGVYFTRPDFHAYFLNILGDIHYYLPGVFTSNPIDKVNGQLWAVPYELYCYVALACLALLGIFKNRHWLLVCMLMVHIGYAIVSFYRTHGVMGAVSGKVLIMMFLAGITLYRYKDKIVFNTWAFIGSLILSLMLLSVPNGERFAAFPIAYVTVYVGLLNPPKNKLLLSGDYSYGLYLYGFPIQQAFASLGPHARHWYWNLIVCIPCACLVAIASWWLVEKPVLNRRDTLKTIENWYINNFKRTVELSVTSRSWDQPVRQWLNKW
jgi:peptidoglycan/LPS O-acetylase OafA/YrhL